MYTTRHIRFTATDKWKLAGLLFEPTTASLINSTGAMGNLNRVALYLHGNGGASIFESVEKTQAYAQYLSQEGIAFFSFNNRGAGYMRTIKKDTPTGEEQKKAGTAYELIEECVADIDGALAFLSSEGYTEYFIIGESTGANKIVVYEHLKKPSSLKRLVLVSGGDDSGIFYEMLGAAAFRHLLASSVDHIAAGRGMELVPSELLNGMLFSWQSLYDILNPDGLYNIFPYNDYLNKRGLATKPLFTEFSAIQKPLLVVYGGNDEYCYGRVPEIQNILKEKTKSKQFAALTIPGADHGFSGKIDSVAKAVAGWLSL